MTPQMQEAIDAIKWSGISRAQLPELHSYMYLCREADQVSLRMRRWTCSLDSSFYALTFPWKQENVWADLKQHRQKYLTRDMISCMWAKRNEMMWWYQEKKKSVSRHLSITRQASPLALQARFGGVALEETLGEKTCSRPLWNPGAGSESLFLFFFLFSLGSYEISPSKISR